MNFFNKDKKKELLQGRTIRYVAKEILDINEAYLSAILNGYRGCSMKLANKISRLGTGIYEDYFKKENVRYKK